MLHNGSLSHFLIVNYLAMLLVAGDTVAWNSLCMKNLNSTSNTVISAKIDFL